jgi:hypothetical protein
MLILAGPMLLSTFLAAPPPQPRVAPLRDAIARHAAALQQPSTKPSSRAANVAAVAVAGAAVGALLGWVAGTLDDCDDCGSLVPVGAVIGGLAGAGIGAMIPTGKSPDTGPRIAVQAGRHAVGVRGIIRWR